MLMKYSESNDIFVVCFLWNVVGRLGAEFAHSFTIRPSVYHGREKRQIWNTHQEVLRKLRSLFSF